VFPLDKWVIDDADPPHGWASSHAQFNGGAMDGFVTQYAEDGANDISLVMGYHVREHLPVYWALADNFVLCERWYASVMSSTWPNRFYLHLATSGGQMGNDGVSGIPSIFDRLDAAGITNVYYNSNLPFTLTYGKTTGVEPISAFFEAAEAGNLPQFVMVEPSLTALDNIGNDDHPPADIRMGQAFIASVYQALANSPQWDKCLLVIMYDEHGGFYDHVPPPAAFDELPEFEQLGFRVPALVVGPHVRRGCVSSTQFDHVSVIATATRKWGLEPLNERVTMTNDLSSAIDPLFVDDPQPPAALPPMEIHMPKTFTRVVPYRGGQVELFRLADRLALPRHLDMRREHDRVMRRTLEWGARLGAVKIVG
jgi:phospholipase C